MESWLYLGYCIHFFYISTFILDYNKSGEESEEFDDLNSSNVFLKISYKLKKKGRKCQWSETLVNIIDLVDIIVENDKYRHKFLMTNARNPTRGHYMDYVVKELKERCVGQGEVLLIRIKPVKSFAIVW